MARIEAWEPQASDPGGFADESALVAGLRAGSPEAFEALHAAYATSIYTLALRIVDDPHEAQDVAQEVLIKVLRGLPRKRGEFRLPAWLYRVTVNAAFDHVRARKRRPVALAGDALPEPAAPVDEFERAELSRRLEMTLRELPKRQQLALVLRDVHGLTVGETASVLGITRASADVLLTRARAGFRKLYLAGVRAAGRCAEAERILSGGVGGGISARQRARLQEHAKRCPDCRHTVELWSIVPVGLGLLPQVALPAKLSIGATLAAAKAAGVALPAGLGAAAATAATTTAGAAAGSGAAAAVTGGAAGAISAAGASHGLLEVIGSAAGVKIATLAAVATAALGIAGVATHENKTAGHPAGAVPAKKVAGAGAERGDAAAAVDTLRAGRLSARADGAGKPDHGGLPVVQRQGRAAEADAHRAGGHGTKARAHTRGRGAKASAHPGGGHGKAPTTARGRSGGHAARAAGSQGAVEHRPAIAGGRDGCSPAFSHDGPDAEGEGQSRGGAARGGAARGGRAYDRGHGRDREREGQSAED